MKRKLHFLGNKCFLFLITLTLSQKIFSQSRLIDAGITIGPCNLLGDLGGNIGRGTTFLKDNNLSQTKVMVGAHLTVSMNNWLSVRAALNQGGLSGDDAVIVSHGGEEESRKVRNLNMKTSITELFVAAEVFPTVFLEQSPEDNYHKLRPYGLIGIGGFHMNPKGKDPATGQWIALKPLHTEGQGFAETGRKEYSLFQLNIPMGVGIRYYVSETFNISLEVIHRKTFTDYLDDVSTTYIDPSLLYQHLPASQAAVAERMADKRNNGLSSTTGGDKRGTSTNNDGYYSLGFKLSFTLFGGDRGYRNSTRCPILRF